MKKGLPKYCRNGEQISQQYGTDAVSLKSVELPVSAAGVNLVLHF